MFKVITQQTEGNFGKFALEPLEAGLGHTLGNSLRRVLLNNLEGSGIVSVKIDGVSHQFSPIDGISQDVIEIILNLKKVRVKVHGSKPVKLTIKASGKKEVKAKDFEITGDGEIANPDAEIATLTDAKSKLNLEVIAEKGKGYSLSEDRKTNEIGVMAVDTIFSPITSVNYTVEPTRVGRKADYDRLILEITTDGTISPKEALDEAAKLLSTGFKQIYEPVPYEEVEETPVRRLTDEALKLSVEELDLPVRITNALKAIDIETVDDLINTPKQQLMKAKNLGSKSVGLVSEKLSERGLSLSEA